MLIPVPAHSANIVARFLHRHPGRQALLRGCAMVRHEWLAAVSSSTQLLKTIDLRTSA
jgi:hypothetical protein